MPRPSTGSAVAITISNKRSSFAGSACGRTERGRLAPGARSRSNGDRLDQRSRVRMRRPLEQSAGPVEFHDAPALKDCHAVTETRDRKQVVRNVEAADARLAV